MIADTGLSPSGKIGLCTWAGCCAGTFYTPPKARFHWSGIKRAITEDPRP